MNQVELAKYRKVIDEAREMWEKSAREYYDKNGDTGSCVIGAGIKIEVIPPRCRKPRAMMLISANEVARCQGSLHWEHNVQTVVNYLRDNGLNAFFDYGRMD